MHRIQQEKKRQKQNPWTKIQLYSYTCLSKLKYVTYKRQKMLHRMYLCVHSNKLNVFAPSSLFQFNTLQHVKRLFQIKDKSTRQNPKRHIFLSIVCLFRWLRNGRFWIINWASNESYEIFIWCGNLRRSSWFIGIVSCLHVTLSSFIPMSYSWNTFYGISVYFWGIFLILPKNILLLTKIWTMGTFDEKPE